MPIKSYVVSSFVDNAEAEAILDLLKTPLAGFLGQAYNYDDHKLTEEWMCSFVDADHSSRKSARVQIFTASDDDVIRTQIESLMEIWKVQVQDRVCNETGVLAVPPIDLGPRLKEVPVWGIDSFTRKNMQKFLKHIGDDNSIQRFIENRLLPAINAQSPEAAHEIRSALQFIKRVRTT